MKTFSSHFHLTKNLKYKILKKNLREDTTYFYRAGGVEDGQEFFSEEQYFTTYRSNYTNNSERKIALFGGKPFF